MGIGSKELIEMFGTEINKKTYARIKKIKSALKIKLD